jgi:hypothetical protein
MEVEGKGGTDDGEGCHLIRKSRDRRRWIIDEEKKE